MMMMSAFSLSGFPKIINFKDEDADSQSNNLDSFETDSEMLGALTTKGNFYFTHTLQFELKNGLKKVGQLGISLDKF